MQIWIWWVLGGGVGILTLAVVGGFVWFLVRRKKSRAGDKPKTENSSQGSKNEKEDKDMVQAASDLGSWKRAVEERDTLLKAAYTDIAVLKQYVPALAESDRLLREAYAEIVQKDATIKALRGQISGLGAPAAAPVAPTESATPGAGGSAPEKIVPPPARPSRTPAAHTE